MTYYWTTVYNSGEFTYWKVEDEKQLFKLAAKRYCGKAFDYGVTSEKNYKNGLQGN